MSVLDEATQRQVVASDPAQSTWLSANAGSGKTRVLTDRVARLLLDGVPPQHILCLTYTKAAAGEMQNRLFGKLGAWSMARDAELSGQLSALAGRPVSDPVRLAAARTLFARAIETPGGLKIQTIHSFCSALLRRFPMEAGVSPQFVEMDEQSARLLKMEVLEALAEGPGRDAVDAVARLHTGESLSELIEAIARHRAAFRGPVEAATIWRDFGLPPGFDTHALARQMDPGDPTLLPRVIAALRQGGAKTDLAAADTLAAVASPPGPADLDALAGPFLYGSSATANTPFTAKIGSFPTKAVREGLDPATRDALEDYMRRIEVARERRNALGAAERMLALHRLAAAFLPAYEARKQQGGWLDFDDLIGKARQILSDPAVADWVLFRLDGGIDHILVDEAQDTSPPQWDVIERLTREFAVGIGARADVERTIFVVGDLKQSIYSFQGADPAAFDRMRADFETRLSDAGSNLRALSLDHSFRSSRAILDAVDATFAGDAARGLAAPPRHEAFHDDLPGRVDLWPALAREAASEEVDWRAPVDAPSPENAGRRLARAIADEIARMRDEEAIRDAKGNVRPVRDGDILILLQRRGDLFFEIIRACKARGLAVAGADRLKVAAELAVRDITALLSVLALPEDDLSLATVLRSPLFGWDEQQLYSLAHHRHEVHLWPALSRRRADFPETLTVLEDLRDVADFLRPFELIERILTRHGGRQALIARLGPEAEDGIDALLAQAMTFETANVPSLTAFLAWMQTDEVEIRRQLDADGDRIRVMTVHGAKGLESPIVILPDTAKRRPPPADALLADGQGKVMWAAPKDELPEVQRTARNERAAALEDERRRLLYVAMTRAENWLIVAAAGDVGQGEDSWYTLVEAGMTRAGAAPAELATGTGMRLAHGTWPDRPASAALTSRDKQGAAVPDWIGARAPEPPPAIVARAPSDLGGAKALPGEGGLPEDAAKRRGRHLHLLLENLPRFAPDAWARVGADLLSFGDEAADPDEIVPLVGQVTRILTDEALAPLFAPGTAAEVEIAATLPELDAAPVRGAIDRLVVTPDLVTAIDFKSNAVVPDRPEDVPEGVLRQLGAYASALGQIYPQRRIETAILWTTRPLLMPVPHEIVIAALRRAATS